MVNLINSMSITRGVRNILLVNILVFLFIEISNISDLKYLLFINYFSLIPIETISNFQIWRLFTYLFIHGDFFHLFFNLLVLFFVGNEVEKYLGTNSFYIYYFICGVGGGCMVSIFNYSSIHPIVGSSGAIFGLLYSLSIFRPQSKVYLYFIFPIKISMLVKIIIISSLLGVIFMPNSQISHITHLCGILSGHLYFYGGYYLRYIKKYFFVSSNKNNHLHIANDSDKEIDWNQLTHQQKKKIIDITRDEDSNEMLN